LASEESILDLIGAIYDAAITPELWPEVARDCVNLLGANMGALAIVDLEHQKNDVFVPLELDPSLVPLYSGHFVDKDVWLLRAQKAAENAPFTGSMLVPIESLMKTEFYNEILAPQRIRHLTCTHFFKTSDSISYLSAFATDRLDDFTQRELAILRTLGPHLKRAVQLRLEVIETTAHRDLVAEMLNRADVGVILIDASANVLDTNRIADEIVAKNDGLSVTADGLRAATRNLTAALLALIADATATGSGIGMGAGGTIALARPSMKRALEVVVSPLNARSESSAFVIARRHAAAIILIRDPERELVMPTEMLSQLYGLTNAEARLGAAIGAGTTLAEYADEAGVTVHTARSTLKQVMAKTDTRRQAELVRHMLTGLAAFGRRDEESI